MSASNPNDVWGPNQYPHLNGEGLASKPYVPLAPGGNTVDMGTWQDDAGTKTGVSNGGGASASRPLGGNV